jgi:hypothetical protein
LRRREVRQLCSRALLACDWFKAKEDRCDRAYLHNWAKDRAAIALYESLEFVARTTVNIAGVPTVNIAGVQAERRAEN